MHYTVTSWNELLSANTDKLKSSNSLCHRAKPKHLEADSATGSGRVTTEDQSGDTLWSETLFLRYSSVTKRLIRVLFSMLGMHAGMTVWCRWYNDADVFVLLLVHGKNLNLKRCYMKGGRGANFLCNSITGCDNISTFFGKGKWTAVQLLQPMEGTSELWRLSRERVSSIKWKLKIQDTGAPVCELYGKKWHSVDVLATRFIPSLRLEGQAGESAAVRVIFSALQEQLSSLNVKEKQLLLFLSLAR